MLHLFNLKNIYNRIIIFLIYCGFVIKRHWIDKKPFKTGTQFVGLNTFKDFQSGSKKAAIEHIQQMDEEKEEEDSGKII